VNLISLPKASPARMHDRNLYTKRIYIVENLSPTDNHV